MFKPLLTQEGEVKSDLNRPLGAFEKLIWLVDQWTTRNFAVVARIEGHPVSSKDLKVALSHAQRRHPALRTAIQVHENGIPRFVSCGKPIDLRVVVRTNDSLWLQKVEAELALPFPADKGPLLRACLVEGTTVSELILTAHHSIGDGVSSMYLVRDLLESIEGHCLEELPPRPPLEDIVPSVKGAPLQEGHASSHAPAKLRIVDRPQKQMVQTLDISSSELERVLARCRDAGTTLQGALLAAVLLSLPEQESVHCLSPVNLRSLSPTVVDDFGLFLSSGMATLDRETAPNFWTVARAARQQVLQALDPQGLRQRIAAMASVVSGSHSPQSMYENVWRRIGYNAVLTNLGRFPNMPKVKRFRVTALYPIQSPDLEVVIAVATTDQRLSITISSDAKTGAELLPSFVAFLRRNAGWPAGEPACMCR